VYRFVDSVSQQYSDEYPGELSDSIPESDFIRTMARINRLLATFWPCTTFFVCGLACTPCTLALSQCCPVMCRPEVESRLLDDLRDISLHARYYDRGIVWQLNKTLFGGSSIEIVVPDYGPGGLVAGHVDVEVGRGNKES